MHGKENMNYKRIAEAIEYIKNNFKKQPNLDDIAKEIPRRNNFKQKKLPQKF